MTQIDEDTTTLIRNAIRDRRFGVLTAKLWCDVLKSLVREQAEEEASYGGGALDPTFEQLPNMRLHSLFRPQGRDESPDFVARNFLKEELPASVRPVLSEGLELFVSEYLARVEEEDAKVLLLKAVYYENWFGPIMSGSLAETIALNRKLPVTIRRVIVQNMLERSFPMSVSNECWTKIQEEVPQVPVFAAPVMKWLLTEDIHPGRALEVPLAIRPPEDDNWFILEIQEALEEALGRVNLNTDSDWLRNLLSRYPTWGIEVIQDLASIPARIGGRVTEFAALLPSP